MSTARPRRARRRAVDAVWLGLLIGTLVLHVVQILAPGDGIAVSVAAVVVPALYCWFVAWRAGRGRAEIQLTALAVSAFAAGNVYYSVRAAMGSEPPFPSVADVLYLGFYPFMVAAVVVVVRRQAAQMAPSVALDTSLGALGAAAVLSVPLGPLVTGALADMTDPLAALVAAAFPVSDLVLVAALTAVALLRSSRQHWHWRLLIVGLLIFTVADTVYALQVASGTYTVGTLLDSTWPTGLTLVALWARRESAYPYAATSTPRVADTRALLATSGVATAAAVGVLIVGSIHEVTLVAVGLAALTLATAAARTLLVFRQLRRMADLRRQATTDDLTGLPNRRALYQAAPRLFGAPGARRALLLLDLDKFKEVNDSLGHQVGDELLAEVSRRLDHALYPGDMLARLGGDEFAVVLDDADADTAARVAGRIRAAVAEPFALAGLSLQVDVSIGIAVAPDHGRELGLLLRRADIAMYGAKARRLGHLVFALGDDAASDAVLRTRDELRHALGSDELVLHFQPKVELDTGDVHGVEALVRWQHPTRGLLYPDSFLALVEDAGLMRSLTTVVLGLALDQVIRWRADGLLLEVAVNLSASSLVDVDLPQQVGRMLAERGLPASQLKLEITEEFLMADHARARTTLELLQAEGVRIAVDDFGTGYSSLAYLRDLPIDELKLDRSFVMPMTDDHRASALVASTIALSHSLGLRMTAEGVEDGATLERLRDLGCDEAQGYHLSRPLPGDDLGRWLRALRAAPAVPAGVG